MNRSRIVLAVFVVAAVSVGLFVGAAKHPPAAVALSKNEGAPSSTSLRAPSARTGGAKENGRPWLALPAWHLQPQQVHVLKSRLPRVEEASVVVAESAMPSLRSLKEGERVSFSLGEDGVHAGVVTFADSDVEGVSRLAGELDGHEGSFAFGNRQGAFGGLIELPGRNLAVTFSRQDDGMMRVQRMSLSKLKCAALPAPADQPPISPLPPPAVPSSIPALDSRPSATAVLYIDFDGASVQDPAWGSGKLIVARPALINNKAATATDITNIFQRVAEDFRPFDIAVTTIESRYSNAPLGQRMRCIVTPTQYFAENPYWTDNIGGAAWVDTFSLTGSTGYSANNDVPCFVFVRSTPEAIAHAISHEFGHTMGLKDQGTVDPYYGFSQYYAGHGVAPLSWAPIMGLPYNHNLTQWSKGEYSSASTEDYFYSSGTYYPYLQDDIALMKRSVNQLALAADEAGDTPGSSAPLGDSGKIVASGVVSSDTDVDMWTFDTRGGAFSIVASPATVDPNLDISLQLLAGDGATVIASANPLTALNATISKSLAAGTYYVTVAGVGKGDKRLDGYSTYGSLGAYTLSGSFAPVPAPPLIAVQPQSKTVAQGTTATLQVTPTANVTVSYQWQKQNPDMSFSSLPGKTAAILSLPNVQFANQGVYRVIVTNAIGTAPLPSVTSDPATLTVNAKPLVTVQPPDTTTVAAGPATNVTISLAAAGSPTLHYQWFRDTTAVGSDAPALAINSAQFVDGASYKCVVSNAYGSVTSTVSKLVVTSAPVIVTDLQPAVNAPLGGTLTLAPVIVGSPVLTFQWYKDGSKITGATKSSLVLSKIAATAAGSYHVEVKNSFVSVPVPSANCVVTVLPPPVITVNPVATTVAKDAGCTLNATATNALSYQWQQDGVNLVDGTQTDGSEIVGATTPSLTINQASWTRRGLYRLVATNLVGTATSKTAQLNVQSLPIITTQPARLKIARGGKGVLSVTATGSPALSYQWHKNTGSGFAPVVGAKAASLTITGIDGNVGVYQVVVTNAFGTVTSVAVNVIVENPPKILTQPLAQTRAVGSVTTLSVILDAAAANPPTEVSAFRYQWQKNSVNLMGETNATLQLSNLQAGNTGAYRVIVSNDVGTVTSAAATLTVIIAPSITQDPVATTVNAFEPLTLTALATGSATLKYQWFNGSTPVPGATAATYKVVSAQPGHSGAYHVTVTNGAGSATSATVNVVVNPVLPAIISSMTPTAAQIQTQPYIYVDGANLNWTLSVSMMKSATAATPCSFKIISPSRILVHAPRDAITSPIKITTRGGVVTTAPFTISGNPANDIPQQAIVFSPDGGLVVGDNTSFTYYDGSDPMIDTNGYYYAYRSAWHRFTPTVTGVYRLFYYSALYDDISQDYIEFNPRVAVFDGDPLTSYLSNANNVANNRFYGNRPKDATQYFAENFFYAGGASFSFTAEAGKTYWIIMAGWTQGGSYTYAGGYQMSITLNKDE